MMQTPTTDRTVVGRFAPSPTGPLHLGSLLTALASYLAAKSIGGRWLLRIEDTDFERCSQTHTDAILATLEAFGLYWDGAVRYQSQHINDYDAALSQLKDSGAAFACACSRKSLKAYAKAHNLADAHTYPNICTRKSLSFAGRNVRVQLTDKPVCFLDLLQGEQQTNPKLEFGAVVIKRRNGIYNYVLTSVVDDAAQGVNQIVRGIDLLELTSVQLALNALLVGSSFAGFTPHTSFAHLPVLVNNGGQKLSKQNKATPVTTEHVPAQLNQLLALLKQPKVAIDLPKNMLMQAIAQWDISALAGIKTIKV